MMETIFSALVFNQVLLLFLVQIRFLQGTLGVADPKTLLNLHFVEYGLEPQDTVMFILRMLLSMGSNPRIQLFIRVWSEKLGLVNGQRILWK